MEPVSIAVGSAVAKWAFKLWAGDTPFADLGADLVGIVSQKVSDPFQARRVRRQFEQLADEVAKRLEPYLAHEIRGLDEGEQEAVCLAAQETLNAAVIDSRSLLRLDLDPAKVRSYMVSANPGVVERGAFSQAGKSLYDTLLTEISEYVSAVATTLPGFATHQAAELLARESQIIELIHEVLNKLPKSEVPLSWGGQSDVLFENEYRKRIFRYADRLQLFGVGSGSERVSYSLSVAYISMSVDTASPTGRPRRPPQPLLTSDSTGPSAEYLSVEEALSTSPYVMVSGSAGSGKTTLVQWIAASAANKSFTGNLAEWNGKIPFILPLRRFVDQNFPSPEDFVRPLLPNIADTMPTGWVHRALDEGNGIVLVDGLDEVPSERRIETKEWLESLIESFPDNRYILTSRTTALSPDITNITSFHHAQLLPMELSDIKSFVAHWHAAALRNSATEEEKEAVRLSERLVLDTIRDRSSIRSLCTSPLLCALVCALNRDRGGNIPENRMDLYDTALRMLVVSRDEARRIQTANISLNYREAFVLLSSFALWLHENSHTDADKTQFENRIEAQLGALHKISSSKEVVAQHLLVRSGVLREPIPGRVDFVHRTFLEYLAAAAIVEDDSIEKLIMHGHEDYWREVIILAAGHAKAKDRERLIRGLILRGNAEEEHTHSLFLLAVACMETSTELSPELQRELQSCLRLVMPPRNMTDAAAVASAGSIAVPLLASFRGNAIQTAACVRALVLIGGEEALNALVNFSSDGRLTVIREIMRGWSSFPLEDYLERVLRGSRLDRGHIVVRDVDQLALVDRLENVKSIGVDTRAPDLDWSLIPEIDVPVSFYLGPKSGLIDLAPFSRFPLTTSISLRNAESLISLKGIESLQELRVLNLEGCASLVDIGEIRSLQRLTRLDLSRTGIEVMPQLAIAEPLASLNLSGCRQLSNLGTQLDTRQLDLRGCIALRNFDFLEHSLSLASLSLSVYPDRSVRLPVNLLRLDWYGENIDVLEGAYNLVKLRTGGEPDVSKVVDFVLRRPLIDNFDLGFVSSGAGIAELQRLSVHPGLKIVSLFLFDDDISVPEIDGFKMTQHRRWIRYSKKGSVAAESYF